MEASPTARARLPRVAFEEAGQVVGRNTVASMQSGLVFGYAGLTDFPLHAHGGGELGFPVTDRREGGISTMIAKV